MPHNEQRAPHNEIGRPLPPVGHDHVFSSLLSHGLAAEVEHQPVLAHSSDQLTQPLLVQRAIAKHVRGHNHRRGTGIDPRASIVGRHRAAQLQSARCGQKGGPSRSLALRISA